MKICQILASRGEGGLERHVRDLSRALSEAGHQVTIFTDTRMASGMAESVHIVPIRFDRSRFNPLLIGQLLAALRICQCDIIHAHANKAASIVSTLKHWIPCPTVGTLHNVKRRTREFNKLDHVIAVSALAGERLLGENHTIIQNGIEAKKPSPFDLRSEFHVQDGMPILCAVGRLVPAKGFDTLLDAIDGLSLTLLIAGEGTERTRLEARISRLKPPTRCMLLGHRKDTFDIMASADGLILSSRHEGFPYVLVEGLFAGARILTTRISGVDEFFPPELIVPVGDPAALRERIAKLLDTSGQWEALMTQPRQFAHNNLTLQAMTRATLSVYETLTSS